VVINGAFQFGFKDGGQVIVPGISRVHCAKRANSRLIETTGNKQLYIDTKR
jgi:hypothetical protein